MADTRTDIRTEVERRIREIEKLVHDLEEKVAANMGELTKEKHRLDITKEFYTLELERLGVQTPSGTERPLFDMEPRFATMTAREACRQLLQGRGPMHARELQVELEKGGKKLKKPAITSVLVRGKEFERVRPNTFKLIE
ncbi:hypothetical protein ACFLX9_02905 [Chloroflexota bacterium]